MHQLYQDLRKAIRGDDKGRTLDVLTALECCSDEQVVPSLSTPFGESRDTLARTVGKLRKSDDPQVVSKAGGLVARWKKAAAALMPSTNGAAAEERPTSARNSTSPTRASAADDVHARFAITFGEVAILHVGGSELGAGMRAEGFSVEDLDSIAAQVREQGGEAEVVRISDALPEDKREGNEAATLVIRNGAQMLGVDRDELLREQRSISYDKKFFDGRRKKTLNKRARYNVCFGEEDVIASEDFTTFTVHAFKGLEHLSTVRESLPVLLGEKATGLNAEGNFYFEAGSGIGFHGDSERKIVVCLSLGAASTLRYQWRLPGSSEHPYPPTDIQVSHGDIYVMSEKATGWDWKLRSKTRVVHAAGHVKYIGKE